MRVCPHSCGCMCLRACMSVCTHTHLLSSPSLRPRGSGSPEEKSAQVHDFVLPLKHLKSINLSPKRSQRRGEEIGRTALREQEHRRRHETAWDVASREGGHGTVGPYQLVWKGRGGGRIQKHWFWPPSPAKPSSPWDGKRGEGLLTCRDFWPGFPPLIALVHGTGGPAQLVWLPCWLERFLFLIYIPSVIHRAAAISQL